MEEVRVAGCGVAVPLLQQQPQAGNGDDDARYVYDGDDALTRCQHLLHPSPQADAHAHGYDDDADDYADANDDDAHDPLSHVSPPSQAESPVPHHPHTVHSIPPPSHAYYPV